MKYDRRTIKRNYYLMIVLFVNALLAKKSERAD